MIVLIDNGHGAETPGKRSPDGRLREYAWTRRCAARLQEVLQAKGMDARLLVPEQSDISLRLRAERANNLCRKHGKGNVLLVSIHNDAAGNNGAWYEARGFSALVGYNASQASKRLAATLWDVAQRNARLKGNRWRPAEGYKTQNLAICRDTYCPAVLCECLFQDNREDVAFLLTEQGVDTVATAIADGICEYLNK